jgi:hypothetical protein
MTGPQSDKGILLDEGGLKFVVPGEVAFVEYLDRILVLGDSMGGLHDLQHRVRNPGSMQGALRTVE